jgi:hypothetical protein
MEEPYPDIEIYIEATTRDAIVEWLESHFSVVADVQNITLLRNDKSVKCLIVPDATDGFTSVWFSPNHTPWKTDLECSQSAYQHFQVEIRCSTGSWQEDTPGWMKVNGEGCAEISWKS